MNDTTVILCQNGAAGVVSTTMSTPTYSAPTAHAVRGVSHSAEVTITTFAPHTPVTTKVTTAMCQLHQARRDGDAVAIYTASKHLAVALELLPTPSRTLAETDPELDARLRVSWH